MSISLMCSGCGKRLRAKDEFAGKRLKCPGCRRPLAVPSATAAAPVQRLPALWLWVAGGAGLALLAVVGLGAALTYWLITRTDRAQTGEQAIASVADAQTPRDQTEKPAQKGDAKPPAGIGGGPMRALPGANGPRLQKVGKPPPALQIKDIFVTDKDPTMASVPQKAVFPSGSPRLGVVVSLGKRPPQGTRIDIEVFGAGGAIKLAPTGTLTHEIARYGQVEVLMIERTVRPEAGPFADGNFQAEVKINGELHALLNWTVGDAGDNNEKPAPKEAGEVDAKALPRDGPGDPALTYDMVNKDPVKHRGKRVTWSFVPLSSQGKSMMCAVNMSDAMGPRHYGIYVVEFASDKEAGAVFMATAAKPGSTVTATVAGTIDQFLVIRGPDGVAQKDIPKVTVPLLLFPTTKIPATDKTKSPSPKEDATPKPKPANLDAKTMADLKLALDFFRGGGLWATGVIPKGSNAEKARNEREWFIVVFAHKTALARVSEITLGGFTLPPLPPAGPVDDGLKASMAILRVFERGAARQEFFRQFAEEMDKGELKAVLVKTAPIPADGKVEISGAAPLTKKLLLELVK